MKTRWLPVLLPMLAALLGCEFNSAALAENADVIKKPLPTDFPELKRDTSRLWLTSNGSGMESEFTKLYWTNSDLLRSLSGYTADSITAMFGERMKKEQDVHVKLLLAAFAAENGNVDARKFIEEMAEKTDYKITLSRLSALRHLIASSNPQEWVLDAVHNALKDTRKAAGMEKSGWQSGTEFDVSYLADEMEHLTYAAGQLKNPKSVPVLIEMAKRTDGSRGPVTALGMIGDSRAIPLCLEFLQREDKAIKDHTSQERDFSHELVAALAGLKATEAVPMLLNYLHSPEVITALGGIGDERAIEPLKKMVADQGHVPNDPYDWKGRFQQRVFAARMALIKLEKDDPYPKWIVVLQDKSLEWSQRREAVWELGWHPDPRAIPPLIATAKSDPDGAVVNQTITVLSAFKYKAAVAGLIECFDADFKGKSDWKRANTPDMFADNIAKTLHTLTGQDFGPDKTRWLKWWNEEGKKLESLK